MGKKHQTIKEFLNDALPGSEGGHVLALGEFHMGVAHLRYLDRHLESLRDDHNVSVIGFEHPPFWSVLLWAYAEGKLPSELKTRQQQRDYIIEIFTVFTHSEDFAASIVANVDLALHAIDAGIQVVNFDTRSPREGYLPKHYIEEATREVEQSPELRAKYRENPKSMSRVDMKLRRALAMHEIEDVLKANPQFQDRLDAIEAVALAERSLANEKKGQKRIPHDALSAEVMAAHMPVDGNAITLSGLMHISGLSDDDKITGTFARHLGRHLKTTTALAGSSREVKTAILYHSSFEHDMARQNVPFHIPPILLVESDKVITEGNRWAFPGSVSETLGIRKYVIHRRHPHLDDITLPTKRNVRELERVTEQLKDPIMAEAINNLRNNQPWVDTINNPASSDRLIE